MGPSFHKRSERSLYVKTLRHKPETAREGDWIKHILQDQAPTAMCDQMEKGKPNPWVQTGEQNAKNEKCLHKEMATPCFLHIEA
jgi:hypothetical protein